MPGEEKVPSWEIENLLWAQWTEDSIKELLQHNNQQLWSSYRKSCLWNNDDLLIATPAKQGARDSEGKAVSAPRSNLGEG